MGLFQEKPHSIRRAVSEIATHYSQIVARQVNEVDIPENEGIFSDTSAKRLEKAEMKVFSIFGEEVSKIGTILSWFIFLRIVDSNDISTILEIISKSEEKLDRNVLAVIESLDQFEDELAKLLVQANRLAILDEAKRKKQEMKAVLLTED